MAVSRLALRVPHLSEPLSLARKTSVHDRRCGHDRAPNQFFEKKNEVPDIIVMTPSSLQSIFALHATQAPEYFANRAVWLRIIIHDSKHAGHKTVHSTRHLRLNSFLDPLLTVASLVSPLPALSPAAPTSPPAVRGGGPALCSLSVQ